MGVAEVVIVILWVAAAAATALAVEGTGAFLYLAPVYLFCLVASVLVVKKVRQN